jgi:hypothetical protein
VPKVIVFVANKTTDLCSFGASNSEDAHLHMTVCESMVVTAEECPERGAIGLLLRPGIFLLFPRGCCSRPGGCISAVYGLTVTVLTEVRPFQFAVMVTVVAVETALVVRLVCAQPTPAAML